jgi:predicted RNA methylase
VPAVFEPWADELLSLIRPGGGERVLDIACGTGAVARRDRARLSAAGSVVGIDSDEDMLEVARSASSAGHRMAPRGGGRAAVRRRRLRRRHLSAARAAMRCT